jgi:hypothetical protein
MNRLFYWLAGAAMCIQLSFAAEYKIVRLTKSLKEDRLIPLEEEPRLQSERLGSIYWFELMRVRAPEKKAFRLRTIAISAAVQEESLFLNEWNAPLLAIRNFGELNSQFNPVRLSPFLVLKPSTEVRLSLEIKQAISTNDSLKKLGPILEKVGVRAGLWSMVGPIMEGCGIVLNALEPDARFFPINLPLLTRGIQPDDESYFLIYPSGTDDMRENLRKRIISIDSKTGAFTGYTNPTNYLFLVRARLMPSRPLTTVVEQELSNFEDLASATGILWTQRKQFKEEVKLTAAKLAIDRFIEKHQSSNLVTALSGLGDYLDIEPFFNELGAEKASEFHRTLLNSLSPSTQDQMNEDDKGDKLVGHFRARQQDAISLDGQKFRFRRLFESASPDSKRIGLESEKIALITNHIDLLAKTNSMLSGEIKAFSDQLKRTFSFRPNLNLAQMSVELGRFLADAQNPAPFTKVDWNDGKLVRNTVEKYCDLFITTQLESLTNRVPPWTDGVPILKVLFAELDRLEDERSEDIHSVIRVIGTNTRLRFGTDFRQWFNTEIRRDGLRVDPTLYPPFYQLTPVRKALDAVREFHMETRSNMPSARVVFTPLFDELKKSKSELDIEAATDFFSSFGVNLTGFDEVEREFFLEEAIWNSTSKRWKVPIENRASLLKKQWLRLFLGEWGIDLNLTFRSTLEVLSVGPVGDLQALEEIKRMAQRAFTGPADRLDVEVGATNQWTLLLQQYDNGSEEMGFIIYKHPKANPRLAVKPLGSPYRDKPILLPTSSFPEGDKANANPLIKISPTISDTDRNLPSP